MAKLLQEHNLWRPVIRGVGVALCAFLVAVVLYAVFLQRGAAAPTLLWIRALEGLIIAGVTLLAWRAGENRTVALSGLLASITIVTLGLLLPETAYLSEGASALVWATLLSFSLRSVGTRAPGNTAPARMGGVQ